MNIIGDAYYCDLSTTFFKWKEIRTFIADLFIKIYLEVEVSEEEWVNSENHWGDWVIA